MTDKGVGVRLDDLILGVSTLSNMATYRLASAPLKSDLPTTAFRAIITPDAATLHDQSAAFVVEQR